jgi:mono/diheme cytochrome c family protein
MKVKFQFIVAAFFLTLFFVSTVTAIEGGDTRRGKGLMKGKCKVCHAESGQGGKLTPLSKTMSQWDRFFRRDKHQDYPKGFEGLSEQDLLDINQYLFDHAADSDQPQTCG